MATAKPSTRKRKAPKKKASKPFVTPQRQSEIIGALMILLGLLLALAFVSYTSEDDQFARSFSLGDAFSAPSERAQNALGLVGATLSYYGVKQFLGYVILLLPGFLLAWGYVRVRQKDAGHLPVLTVLGFVGAFVCAALLGWFHYQFDAGLELWSGAVGLNIADWMRGVFGSTGSFLLLVVSVLITAMLVIDRDIQKSLQRIEDALFNIREAIRSFWSDFRARWNDGRAKRHEARAAHRAERDQRTNEAPSRTRPPARQLPQQPAPTPYPSQQPLDPIYPEVEPAARAPERPPVRPTPVQPTAQPTSTEAAEPSLKIQERIEEERTNTLKPNVELAEDVPFTFPAIKLLDEAHGDEPTVDLDELEENKQILLDKLETYKIQITDINAIVGPTV
ncbi:MAG: DNA translocase FtsK 4TM domain-containing protein, partial [Bacteroidota bacterium]